MAKDGRPEMTGRTGPRPWPTPPVQGTGSPAPPPYTGPQGGFGHHRWPTPPTPPHQGYTPPGGVGRGEARPDPPGPLTPRPQAGSPAPGATGSAGGSGVGGNTGGLPTSGPSVTGTGSTTPSQDFDAMVAALFPYLPPELHAILADAWDQYGDMNVALGIMRQSSQYEQFFPGNYANGIIAMTEAEYVAYSEGVRRMMSNAGMPTGFYDTVEDIGNFVRNNLSLNEISGRIENGFLAAMNGDQETRDEWARYRGRQATAGELAAFFLDPDRAQSLIMREFAQAQLSAIGIQSGFGRLDLSEAQRLQQVGVNPDDAARRGLSQAASLQPITGRALGSESGRTFSRGQLLEALFEEDADLLRALEHRRSARLNQFRGGGNAAESTSGFTAFSSNKF